MGLRRWDTARPDAWRRRGIPLVGALALLPGTLGAVAALAGWLPADPLAFVGPPNGPPGAAHWLGTDALGRDLASRLAAAAAAFALPAAWAVGLAAGVGTVLGVARGFGGRALGPLAAWVIQVLDGIPKLVLVLLVAAIARSHLGWIMATVGLTFAPQVAGTVAAAVERLRATQFIEAGRALGVGTARLVFVHILWGNARRALLAQGAGLLAYALLVESTLSYLGGELGIQEPTASWGNMIALARDAVFRGHLAPALLPAGLISLTLLGFGLLGTALADRSEQP